MPNVVHFEIPADNIERAKSFYSQLFGWKIDLWEKSLSSNPYWIIDTEGINRRDFGLGSPITGGIIQRQGKGHPFINYIEVDSIDDYIKKVNDLGGKILLSKQILPDVGCFAAFMDTENNIIGLHERFTKNTY